MQLLHKLLERLFLAADPEQDTPVVMGNSLANGKPLRRVREPCSDRLISPISGETSAPLGLQTLYPSVRRVSFLRTANLALRALSHLPFLASPRQPTCLAYFLSILRMPRRPPASTLSSQVLNARRSLCSRGLSLYLVRKVRVMLRARARERKMRLPRKTKCQHLPRLPWVRLLMR